MNGFFACSLAHSRCCGAGPAHIEHHGCVGYKPASEVEAVLVDLCTQFGYCLSPGEVQNIVDHPPNNADSFVSAVLVAEGLTPESLSRVDRRLLSDLIERRLFAS